MNVAEQILSQLGGRKFAIMTGSKNFISGKNSLTMKLSRNSSGANYLTIELNSLDTYDLKFIHMRGRSMKTKALIEGIYNDQLQAIFTQETGLYTRL